MTDTWTVELEEDPETGDLLLPFPPGLLEEAGWQEGDTLVWNIVDGAIHLSKKNDKSQSTQG